MPGKSLKHFAKDKFDYNVFLFVTAIGAVLGAFSVSIDLIVPTPNNSFLDNIGLVYFGCVFLIAKTQRIYKPFVYPTLAILFVISPAFWLESGGLSIIGVLVYIAAIVMCIFIAPSAVRRYVMAAFLAVTILYPAINVVTNWSEDSFDPLIFSTYLYFVFISVGIQFATVFIKISFEKESSNIKGFGQSLGELHRLNMTDWGSIEETFKDYVDSGAQLLGAEMVLIAKKEWNRWRVIDSKNFEWEEGMEVFDGRYKSGFGEIRSAEVVTDVQSTFPKSEIGSLLIVPIHVEGLFFGHFVFGWKSVNKDFENYLLEFAELMAQNLGYLIERDAKSEVEKVTREALNLSEVRFRRVFENAIVGIAVADLNGNFIMVNPAFRKMLGYSEEEMLQMSFSQTGHPDDQDDDIRQFNRLIKSEIDGYHIEKRNLRKDGGVINASHTVSLVNDASGKPLYGIGIIEDITQRKKSEKEIHDLNKELELSIQKLEATNKELESFSYSVSHDLRAPLRAINGFSKILVDEYAEKIDDEGKRLIDVVAGNAKKMNTLIDDLLEFSKLNRQLKKEEKINLNEMINGIVGDLKVQLEVGDVVNIADKLPTIKADKALIRQVFINVISNALKFSSAKDEPKVIISAEQTEKAVILIVEDNGVGFDMKYHDKLFQVFQRLHSEREFKGTGVGLAIVERIIHRHGGRVWATSEPGKGARFNIELPNIS